MLDNSRKFVELVKNRVSKTLKSTPRAVLCIYTLTLFKFYTLNICRSLNNPVYKFQYNSLVFFLPLLFFLVNNKWPTKWQVTRIRQKESVWKRSKFIGKILIYKSFQSENNRNLKLRYFNRLPTFPRFPQQRNNWKFVNFHTGTMKVE